MDDALAVVLEERFSPIVIRFYWVCFVVLHVAGLVYYGFTAWCYWNLPGTRLDVWLSLYRLGMETHHDRVIAVFMGVVAVIHGLYVLWMIFWSLKKRQLVFAIYNVVQMPKCILRFLPSTRRGSRSVHPKGISHYMYRAFFARDGLLGVDGQYFDSILFCREVVGTALQTHQAYRMSMLLPRVQINRVYVALLVANCWTTALVHSVFHANSVKRRVWSLVSDCILDTVTAMGISTVLLAMYINDFDFTISGFPFYKWYEDIWVVHAMSEFQMILVTSWRDLCTRMIFAISLLSDLDSMKMAMRVRRRKRSSSITRSNKHRGNRATLVAPYFASVKLKSGLGVNIFRRKRTNDMLSRISQLVFFLWGLAILILHLYAEASPELSQCWMQVRPWITTQSSCSLLVLNCHADQLQGRNSEVAQQWSAFDPASVTRVVVRHCPALEMPVTLTSFSNLNAIKVYNSTIVAWDDSAALTQSSHPKVMTLFLIRVNLPGGSLPAGLHSSEFPQSVGDIEFCSTNLRSLPDDIDLNWPQAGSIYIEASQLTEVPPSLARLAPFDLSLSMNPISALPVELFEQESVGYLSFGSTLISQLPESVTKLSSQLHEINLSYNNLSFFWPWIDPIKDQAEVSPLKLAGTPYCRDLDQIFAGERSAFTTAPPISDDNGAVSVLADASVGNWATLKMSVSCDDQDKTWYPIDLEDEYSSVSYPGQY